MKVWGEGACIESANLGGGRVKETNSLLSEMTSQWRVVESALDTGV